MLNPIKTFEPNYQGRDFVIGDLHGSFSCFENLLKNIEFDPLVDRMFSVGDLVDRGPDSLKCLSLLDDSWFHCVLSNHEQMMLDAFKGGFMGEYWIPNGGKWGLEALADSFNMNSQNELTKTYPTEDSLKLYKLLDKVKELPYLITVNMKDGRKFHIIHAELPPGHEITDATLSSPGAVEKLATIQRPDGGDCFLWGRMIYYQFYEQQIDNQDKLVRSVAYKFNKSFGPFNEKLGHIISGHTIVQKPLTIVGQTNIDTGAYKSYSEKSWPALTCVQLDTWKFYQATETEFRVVEPVAVNRDDLQALYDREKAKEQEIQPLPPDVLSILK